MRRWWLRQSQRRQRWIRWGGPLLALVLLLALDWWHLQREGVASVDTARGLLRRVGVTCGVSAIVMLAGVRRWPLQSLGLFSMLLGIAGLFVRVIAKWGPQPVPERERDLIQASLDVGSIVLLLGLVIWGISRLRGRGAPSPTNGVT